MNLALIALQPVPVVGGFTLAILCLANYRIYRAALTVSAPPPAPAPA